MLDWCLKRGKFSAPGFRFHPTDEELVLYYLKRKICCRKLRINFIGLFDVYKVDPSELPGLSVFKSGDRQWFFFSPRNRKYPNAARSSRGTSTGYWKATGKDRIIFYNSISVGLKKTLVFYRGRAPNGERTDWVMHEYTMDEQELARCNNAMEYYALYKLYKKSGAGPKNGEEYGAPFQEEEWADDDSEDDDNNNVVVPYDPSVRYENSCRVDDRRLCNPVVNVQLDDIEKFLNEIPDAPEVTPRQVNGFSGVLQGNGEKEIHNTFLNNSPEPLLQNRHLRSANSFEVKSVFEKEDYIEMDDILLTPEIGAVSTEKPAQLFSHGEFGNLNEFDQLFNDVSVSLDVEPVLQGGFTDLSSSLSDFANITSDQRQQFLYQQFHDQSSENQLNNFMDPRTSLDQLNDMWFEDAQADLFDKPQASCTSPSQGAKPESKGTTTNDQEGQNGGGTSPFSSSLWAFMESVPSTPASACEGPMNRTFVRMSSFSRIRLSGKANNGTVVNSSKATIAKKKRTENKGFIVLSIVGALCAILWVLIATLGVWKRPVLL
ncbi:unnamed protein product [Cochlearia groenlandica]